MTRQGAERALSELEAFARRDGAHKTDVQGRALAVWYAGNTAMHYYDRRKVDRNTALVLLENR